MNFKKIQEHVFNDRYNKKRSLEFYKIQEILNFEIQEIKKSILSKGGCGPLPHPTPGMNCPRTSLDGWSWGLGMCPHTVHLPRFLMSWLVPGLKFTGYRHCRRPLDPGSEVRDTVLVRVVQFWPRGPESSLGSLNSGLGGQNPR